MKKKIISCSEIMHGKGYVCICGRCEGHEFLATVGLETWKDGAQSYTLHCLRCGDHYVTVTDRMSHKP